MPTSKEQKSTAIVGLIVLIVIAALLIAVALVFLARNYFGADASGERDPVAATESYLHSLPMVTSDGTRLFIDEQPVGSDGRLLYEALSGKWSYAISTIDVTGRKGVSAVLITCPDFSAMASAVREETARELAEALETSDKSDIYNEDDSFHVGGGGCRLPEGSGNGLCTGGEVQRNGQRQTDAGKSVWHLECGQCRRADEYV